MYCQDTYFGMRMRPAHISGGSQAESDEQCVARVPAREAHIDPTRSDSMEDPDPEAVRQWRLSIMKSRGRLYTGNPADGHRVGRALNYGPSPMSPSQRFMIPSSSREKLGESPWKQRVGRVGTILRICLQELASATLHGDSANQGSGNQSNQATTTPEPASAPCMEVQIMTARLKVCPCSLVFERLKS